MKKRDKENLEFIKNIIELENIEAPSNLKSESIFNMQGEKEQKTIKVKPSNKIKTIVSLAACFAIIITALTVFKPNIINSSKVPLNSELSSTSSLTAFASEDDITKAIKELITTNSALYYLESDMEISEDNSLSDGMSKGEESVSSYAETYKQVDGVDEGDIIKNNGKYIFWCEQDENIVKIYDGTTLISTINDFKLTENDTNKITTTEWINNIYVFGDRLIVNVSGDTMKNNGKDAYFISYTKAYLFDISSIKSPKLIRSFRQSGYYNSSRMIGDTLYLISNHYVDDNTLKDDMIPSIAYNDEKEKKIDCDCIYYPENPTEPMLIVVSAIDTTTGMQATKSKAFLGASDNVYCNKSNLYITMTQYNDSQLKKYRSEVIVDSASPYNEYYNNETQIVRIKLDKNDIDFTATGKVNGRVNNQFSLDEHNGYLRIATTSENGKSESNNLFILDEKLQTIGKINDFAKDESIKSVRFIGDTAYIITYKEIDPLFVIDLSNPAKPEIKGSVEITGFSSQLIPVNDTTLLGIGTSTETENGREYSNGLKLALFDISNPEKPKVLETFTKKDSYSEAQYNHHAIVVNKEKGYYAIPVTDDYTANIGAIVIKIEDNKIKTSEFITSDTYGFSPRCTYIDDYLYLFRSSSEKVDKYKISVDDIGK